MNKILYLFLLGTCLVKAMYSGVPETMYAGSIDGPRNVPTRSMGGPNNMPSGMLTSIMPNTNTIPVFTMNGQDSDESADTSSQASTDIQDEITEMLDERQGMADMLDLANMRFDSGKKIYYPSKGYKENTVTLLDILSKVRTKVTKNKKTGQYIIKITIDPIWAPTDIITMPKDELEKQIARKQKRSPQQANRRPQRKSRARSVTPDMEATPNIRMRDIGGLF